MRYALSSCFCILLKASVQGADKLIPQDTAKMGKRSRERLEWNRRTLAGAYDKIGKKDPRWDKTAQDALELAARMFSSQVDPVILPADIYKRAEAAVDAGCDDPILLYVFSRSSVGSNYPGEAESIRRIGVAAKALAASGYPVVRRAVALNYAGNYALFADTPPPTARDDARRDYDAALALLPERARTDERTVFWEQNWFHTLQELIRGYRKLGVAAPAAYERIDAVLAKLPELKVLRLQIRGEFWFTYGWEARTTAFAPNVPQGGFETLEKRIAIARTALNDAWQLRPDDGLAPTYLLDIEKTVGDGDRRTMELWFDRAMKADGNNVNACRTKLDWLDPNWHGTAEEMLAFGRTCGATKNWRSGITLLCAEAHLRYANMLGKDQPKYLGKPEVWREVKSIYDEYLKHYPDDHAARSEYAAISYIGGHYRVAHAQFQTLGDNLTTWHYFPNLPLDALKKMRDKAAQIVARQPGA